MKSTNRIHRNNATKRTESQAITPETISAIAARKGASQVEDAAAKACVLLELIGDHLDIINGKSVDNSTIEKANYFNFGLWMIVSDVTQNLEQTSKEMQAIARGEIIEL